MAYPQKTEQYFLPKVGTYKDLQRRQASVPELGPNEVLVKVHAVSLQYRDLAIAKGQYGAGITENFVPCSDLAGEVISIGSSVTEWKVGDRVTSNFCTDHIYGDHTNETGKSALGGGQDGVLTQYRVLPSHALVRIPSRFSYIQASTLPCAAVTAYNALHGPVPVKAGDYVLIQGTGGVSIFALQFAVASGAIVIATSSSNEKLKVAEKLGAKYLINYKETPDWDKEVHRITGGVGVDRIVDVGGPSTIHKSLNAVRNVLQNRRVPCKVGCFTSRCRHLI
ncbi:GroES-like protein [Coprinellus micaceus]|uniref:GroES-like protein n=1 Tax=Coprinellus micaceus TaxID=71717 RepID=A0A4Y7SDR9_COPMI|nr:GroES-like protein [Coprinellus micaceus]